MVLASVLLASCASGAEPSSSATTTTARPCATTSSPEAEPCVTTATAPPGETFDFCAAGEAFVREYEHADYARIVDPAELGAFMERGHELTSNLGAEAPAEVQLSIKAVAAAFDKRQAVYSSHGYAIGAVTQEEHAVLAAVEADVEDSKQRTHDYLVTRCQISI
jgi:hypothetical protein